MRVRILVPLAALVIGALSWVPTPSVAEPPRTDCAALDPDLAWHGENRQRLEAMIAEHGRCAERPGPSPVAVFDWDNTVIRNDVGDATLFWALRNDVVRQPADWADTSRYLTPAAATALRAACGTVRPGEPLPTSTDTRCVDEILAVYSTAATTAGASAFDGFDHRRMEPAYAWLAQLLAGWTPSEVRGFAAAARQENLAAPIGATQLVGSRQVTGWVRYYDQQRDLVQTLRRNGFDVWVVSASPQHVVEAWAADLGVGANRIVGIRSVKKAGVLTHRLTGCGDVPDGADSVITYIDGKRCWVNQEIYGVRGAKAFERQAEDKRPAFAAGDSTTDLTFVRDATALRLVINRNKAELMCHAYHDLDGRWIVNPMFIQPKPAQAKPYPCATAGATDSAGSPIPAVDDAGHVIPDQLDTVH